MVELKEIKFSDNKTTVNYRNSINFMKSILIDWRLNVGNEQMST